MRDVRERGGAKAPGHFQNQGRPPRKPKVDKEERYQQARERAPAEETPTSEPVEADK